MTINSENFQVEKPSNRIWQRVFTILSRLPWAWLTLMAVFTLATTITVGHFPSYGQPDPKDTGFLLILYAPIIFLLPITLFSWLFWVVFGLSKHFLGLPIEIRRQEVMPFLSGYFVFIWFAFSDFAGLLTWLMD